MKTSTSCDNYIRQITLLELGTELRDIFSGLLIVKIVLKVPHNLSILTKTQSYTPWHPISSEQAADNKYNCIQFQDSMKASYIIVYKYNPSSGFHESELHNKSPMQSNFWSRIEILDRMTLSIQAKGLKDIKK